MAGSLSAPKRRQWWQTLLLPLCLLIILISGGTIVKSSLHPRVDGHGVSGQWRRALDGVVSPSTARAIEEDDVLRKHYTAVINVTAGAAGWLAERYPSMHLEEVRDLLNTHSAELALDPRSHQSGSEVGLEVRANPLAALFGLGGASGASGAGGGIFSGIGDAIKNGLSGVGAGLLGDVAGAGMFLGIGIGQGAASGLNLTTADMAKKVAAKVALSSGMNSTGLNPAIQNLGSGLTSTLVGSIDIKSLGGGASNIGPAVVGLATGIGNGAVTGLKIKNITMPMPVSCTKPFCRRFDFHQYGSCSAILVV